MSLNSASGLLAVGAAVGEGQTTPAPVPRRKKCLRTNASMAISGVGAVIALVFAVVSRADTGPGSTGLFVCAVAFAILVILAWFQRSLERQVIAFSKENDRLVNSRKHLDAENEELKQTRTRLDAENEELKQSNDQLAVQVKNLNKLHDDSVKMIRQLALYGDECKNFNKELSGISHELKETDDSLGLTSDELQKQVTALSALTSALTKQAGGASAV